MSNKKICLFDNPDSEQREVWENGEIVYTAPKSIIDQKYGNVPPEFFNYGIQVGNWNAGSISGDPDALKVLKL